MLWSYFGTPGTATVARSNGNYEGVFAATSTGQLAWLQDCRGDTYGVAVAGGRVYSVGHAHNCANIGAFPESSPRVNYRALAVTTSATGTVGSSPGGYTGFRGRPSPSLVNWFPNLTPGTVSGQTQAAWSVVAAGSYVVLGGEFTAVNGVQQQGLVRMATSAYAPRKQGPQAIASSKPTLVAGDDRTVAVSWKTGWDRDDARLDYAVWRDDTLIDRRTAESLFWRPTTLTHSDADVAPGKHTWKIEVSDPDGNVVSSAAASLTVATPEPGSGPSPEPSTGPTTEPTTGPADQATTQSTAEPATTD